MFQEKNFQIFWDNVSIFWDIKWLFWKRLTLSSKSQFLIFVDKKSAFLKMVYQIDYIYILHTLRNQDTSLIR